MLIGLSMTVKITQTDEVKGLTVLKVEGKLAANDAVMLNEVFANLEAGEAISIDMSGVTFIDCEGAEMISRLEEKGANLVGLDFFIRSVIDTNSKGRK